MKWTMKPKAYKWGAPTLERATLLAGAVGLSTVVLRVGEGSRLFYGCSYMFHLSGDNSRDRCVEGS